MKMFQEEKKRWTFTHRKKTNELGEKCFIKSLHSGTCEEQKKDWISHRNFQFITACVCERVFNIFSFVPTIVLCILFCFSSPQSHSISIFHDNRVTGNKLCTFIEHSNNNGEAVWGNVSCWKWWKYIKLLQVAMERTKKVTKLDKFRKDSNELDQWGSRWFFSWNWELFLSFSMPQAILMAANSSLKASQKNLKTFSL